MEYASPMEASSFLGFPTTYIEVSEFDCLRDEGIKLHERLTSEGIDSHLHLIDGACHGFETTVNSTITKTALSRRIRLLQSIFNIST